MKIIPLQHQEDYEQLLKHINAYKNGITSEAMQSYGIDYKQNFGASIIDLRRVAERFNNNEELAQLLWDKAWRETFILSTLLDDATAMSSEKLESRLSSAPALEVLEQLAYNLAWQLPYLDAFFRNIKQKDEEKTQYFLLKCSTYQLMKKQATAQEIWTRIKAFDFTDQAGIMNILQNLMLRITAADHSLHQDVIDFCAKQKGERWQMLKNIVEEYGVL